MLPVFVGDSYFYCRFPYPPLDYIVLPISAQAKKIKNAMKPNVGLMLFKYKYSSNFKRKFKWNFNECSVLHVWRTD